MNIRIERHHKKPMPTKPDWEVMSDLVTKLGGSKAVADALGISQSSVTRWCRDTGGGIKQRKIILRWHALLKHHNLESLNPYKP